MAIRINSTTTTAAVTSREQTIPLASIAAIDGPSRNLAGDLVFFDDGSGEVAQINDLVPGTRSVIVRRGVLGKPAVAHVAGVRVWTGPSQQFALVDGLGACDPTAESYLPRINLRTGRVYDCLDGQWVQINTAPIAVFGTPGVPTRLRSSLATPEEADLVNGDTWTECVEDDTSITFRAMARRGGVSYVVSEQTYPKP